MAQNRSLLPALTSLRFFAAFAIVILHARGYFGLAKKSELVFWGSQPVSFFFVLSGFILFYCYPRLESAGSTRKFWVARWSRIWPTHFLTFLLAVMLTPVPDSDYMPQNWSFSAMITALANVSLVHSWIPLSSIYASFNAVSWSISVEFFFYLMFPLALYRWRERWCWWLGGSATVVVVAMVACAWLQIPPFSDDYNGVTTSGLFHVSPFVRFFEFLLGMTVGLLFSRRQENDGRTAAWWTGAEATALFFLVANVWLCWIGFEFVRDTLGAGAASWLAHCGSCFMSAVVVYVFAHHRGKISALLDWRPLIILGESSFSLYLLHNLYFATFRTSTHPLKQWPLVLQFPVFTVGILALSYVCWRWYEMPMKKFLMKKLG